MTAPSNAPEAPRLRRVVAASAVAAGLCTLVLPQLVKAVLGFDFVLGAAETRVASSLERNTVTFLSLSGIKAVMATIEGSTVGVGFHLEVGDLIQPAYDYIDFVWHAFLYALGALGLYKLVMETRILELGFPLLGIGLVVWGAGELRSAAALRHWGARLCLLGLVVAYIVPASLLLSQLVSDRYLVPLEERTSKRIEETREPLAQAAERMKNLREKVSILDPGGSFDALASEARGIANQASDAIWDRLQAFLAFVLILLVELLLLPFLSAFLIYRVLSLAVRNGKAT